MIIECEVFNPKTAMPDPDTSVIVKYIDHMGDEVTDSAYFNDVNWVSDTSKKHIFNVNAWCHWPDLSDTTKTEHQLEINLTDTAV